MQSNGDVTVNGAITGGAGSLTSIRAGGTISVAGITTRSVGLAANTDVILNGDITAPLGIAIVSGHNIFNNVAGDDLSTATAGNAGAITIVAGAAFTQVGNVITVTGASATGGTIDFDFFNLTSLNTKSTGGGGNGGNLTLASFTGSDGTGGIFLDQTATVVTTGGNGAGQNGNFVAMSGATTGNGVFMGDVNTTGGTGGGGSVFIADATPNTSTSVQINTTSGAITAGNFTTAPVALTGSDLTVGDITVLNTPVTLSSGGAINAALSGQAITGATTLTMNSGASITVGTVNAVDLRANSTLDTVYQSTVTLTTGSFVSTTGRDLIVNADITAPGGIVMVAQNDITAFTSGVDLSTSKSGAAGNITIVAGAAFSQSGTDVTITGASATGGAIDFDTFGINSIDTRSTGGGGAGGALNMIAFRGTDNTGFVFTEPTDSILTGGNGGGANGSVTIIANQNTGNGVGARGAINTTGGLSGTGDVWIASALPNTTTNVIVNKGSGAITTGNFRGGATANNSVFTDNITVANTTITVTSGANLFSNNYTGFTTLSLTANNDMQFNAISGANLRASAGGNLTSLGTSTLSGSFVATAGTDISLNNDITAPGGIVMVAGRDVIASTGGVIDISTASALASANDITIVAGAAFNQDATQINITGGSAVGGRIDFDAFIVNSITTRSTLGGGAGGDLTLAAFRGTNNTGNVFVDPTTLLTTGGTGAGANGNFVAIAGATQFVGVSMGNVSTTGGAAGTGTVYIADSTPNTATTVSVLKSNASINAGDFRGGTPSASDLTVGNITVNNAAVDIISGGAITVGNITGVSTLHTTAGTNTGLGTISGGAMFAQGGLDVVLNSTVNVTNNISIVVGRDIILNNDLTSPAGLTLVAGNDIRAGTGGVIDISTSKSGAAGDITMVAGAAFTQNAGTVTITGASATGGAIDFDTNAVNSIDSRSTGGGGAGGDINMIAFAGTDLTGFVFTDPTGTIRTGGNGAGANGTFTAIANQNGGSGLGIVGTLNTTGGASGTGDVWIASSPPNTTPNVVIDKNTGSITTGDFRSIVGTNNAVFTGAITVANANITVIGGSIIGNSFTGFSTLSLTSLNDTSYVSATGANLRAGSGRDLILSGATTLTGSFAVTAARDISLNDDITAAGGIVMVAGHDVLAATGSVIDISTASLTASAKDITIVAGALFSQDATKISIGGASATGGRIDFDSNIVNSISTRSTLGGGSGGNLTLAAFTGSNNTGNIFLDPTTVLTTNGTGVGSNGNFVAIAGATQFVGLSMGNINTTGGAAGTGSVYIADAAPNTAVAVDILKSNGSISAGNFKGGTPSASDLTVGNITVNNTTVDIISGGAITVGNITGVSTLNTNSGTNTTLGTVSGGAMFAQAGLDLTLNSSVIVTGNISAVAGRDILLNNDLTAPSGLTLVAGNDIRANTGGVIDISTSKSGAAGDITIVAGAAFTQNAGSVTITGASATGGAIDFDANAVNSIDSRSTGGGGAGGDINMIAFAGTDNTGFVFTDGAGTIRTGGNGAGANGTFTAIGNQVGGNGVSIIGTLNTSGGASGTGDVFIASALPNTTTQVVVNKNTGSITAGNFQGGAAANNSVFTGAITVGNANITLNSGSNIVANSFTGFSTLTMTSVGDTSYTSATGANLRATVGQDLILLGTTTLTGSFAVTANRDMQLNNDITAAGGILMVAGRDIFANTGGVIDISTASPTASANDISIIAGAAFTQLPAGSVTVTGGSASGGSINFDSFTVNSIDARSTALNGSGGDVTLVAFNGGPDRGAILTDTTTSIRTGGSGTGTNGTVTAVAGSNTGGFGIGLLGPINTTGGQAGTGDVYLAGTTPVTAPNVVLSKVSGSITSGDFKGGAVTTRDAFVGDITVNGADITIIAGGQINTNGTFTGTATTFLDLRAGGGVELGAINLGNTSVTAGGFVNINGNITSPGGILIVSGGDIFANNPSLTVSSASTTGNAGSIAMIAGAAFTQNAASVTITGASATGGFIDFDAQNLTALNASSTANGGAGGNITLVAFNGSNNTGDIVSDATTVINASGFTTGSNGNIIMVSGSQNGFNGGVFIGDINLTGQQGTGLISLNTSAPTVPATISKLTANVTAGDFRGGAAVNSDIVAGNLTVRGGTVQINAGHEAGVGNINVSGNGIGAGGTVTVTTNGSNTLDIGDSVSINSILSINANGGATSGNAGTVNVTANGTGGISISNFGPLTATEGNGGHISFLATNGNLDIDTSVATLRANGGTASATARTGGTITLQGNSIIPTGNLNLQANGVSGGAGGTISVTTNNSTINVGTAAGQISAQANGTGGTITFQANGGGDINETATGNLTASTINLGSASGNLILNGTVNGSTAVNLTVTGAHTITGTSTIQGGTLTINAGTAATTLGTNVTALTLNTNGNVTINEANAVNVNAGTVGAGLFTLTSTGGGNIAFVGNVTANGGFNITTSGTGTINGAGVLSSTGQLGVHSGSGTINLSTNVASLAATSTGIVQINEANGITLNGIAAGTFDLTAGSIAQGTGFIQANTVDLNATAGDIGASALPVELNNGANPINLTADATGDIYIHIQGTGALNWGTTNATNIVLDTNGSITTTGDIAATNLLDITTNTLTNTHDLSGFDINIRSHAGSGLTINGGAGGTMHATDLINIRGTGGDLTFNGNQDFFGDTVLTALFPGSALVISAGANVTGHDMVTVNANNTILTGNLVGNPLVFNTNFFTIANSAGDVNLTGNVVFNAQSFAILASGNINAGAATIIDLSDPASTGGNLLLVAGFDFSPATGGQQQNATPYTLGAKSTGGGSINMGALNINISGGNGGALTAVAGAGTTNNGTINLGNINASATTGTAGKVLLIGEGGVTTGNITTTGTTANTVQIAVATPTITGGAITVTNGVKSGPGTFTVGAAHAGNVLTGNINAGNSTVTITGALNAGNTIGQTGGSTLTAGALNLNVGSGTTTLNTSIGSLNVVGGSTSTVSINEANAVTLNGIATGTFNLTAGSIAQGSGFIQANTIDLNATAGNIGASGLPVEINNGATAVNFTADATGDIFVHNQGTGNFNWGTTNATNINVDSNAPIVTTGDITATNVLNITTDTLTNANDLTATTINVQSHAGSGLTINGGAGGGTMNATNLITINGVGGNLTFNGNQDFFGDTLLHGTPKLIISAGANVVGHDMVTVTSQFIDLFGNLVGNPLVIQNNFFTIANSQGDVNLANNVVFVAQSFAILAAGNINTIGTTTIDLSDPAGAGSNLLLVAGYNFNPATAGQVQDATAYTLGAKSASGGSINLGTVNINLSGGAGNGGVLTAVAAAGNTNAGTISLGNINTSATGGTGGKVLLIGQGGVTTGNINTTGTVASGPVQIAVASPTITGGTITVTDGVQSGTGIFTPGAASAGNVLTGNINAGTSNVTITGALNAGNTISQTVGSQLTATTLNLNVGAGTTTLNTAVATLNTAAGGAANVTINNTGNITLGVLSGANLGIDLTATGRVFTPAAGISGIRSVDLTGSAAAGVDAIVITGPISAADIALTANGGSDLNITTNITGTNSVSLNSTAGDVDINAGVTVAAPTVSLNANQSLVVAGNINAPTLSLTSAIDILNGTFTGSIGNPTTLSITSTGGSIGFDAANPFVTNAATFSATALGGNVFISDTSTGGITLLNSGASGQFNFVTAGPVTLNNISTGLNGGPGGDITIQKNGVGTIAIAANANITTVEGDIVINNADINKKTGFITIGDNVTMKGSGTTAGVGDVFIVLGGIPATPVHKKPPKNIQIIESGGGQVFLGKKKVYAVKKTGIVLSGLGRNVVFNMDKKQTKKNITLGNNVHITADPPGDAVAITAIHGGPRIKSAPLSTRSALATTAAAMSLVTSPPPTLAETTPVAATMVDASSLATASTQTAANAVSPELKGTVSIQRTTPLGVYSTNLDPILVNVSNQAGLNMSASNVNGSLNPSTFEAQNFDITSLRTTNFNASTVDWSNLATTNMLNLNVFSTVDSAKPLSSIVLTQTTAPLTEEEEMMEALFNDYDDGDDDSVIDTAMRGPAPINPRLISNLTPNATHKLDNGCALFAAVQNMTVETPHAKVVIDRGSAVLIVSDKHGTAVFDLHDGKKHAVQIITREKTLSMSPGVHITVCPKSHNRFADVNLAETIAHRDIQTTVTESGGTVFTSEFSIPSAIETVRTIYGMIHAPAPEHASLSNNIMKTVAILQILSPSRSRFEQHLRAPMTASGSMFEGQL